MSFGLLSLDRNDFRNKEVLLVAKFAGRKVELEKADPLNFDRWNSGRVFPALRTDEGGVFGLHNALRYLARVSLRYPLYGENFYEQSVIDSWLDWSLSEIDNHAGLLLPVSNLQSLDPAFVHQVFDKLKGSFDTLNKHFLNNTYLVTRRVSIADIAVVFSLIPLVSDICDPGFRKGFPNVFRWFETVINHPAFVEVVGPVTLCPKSPLPPVPKKQPVKKQTKKKGEEDDGEPELEEVGVKLDVSYLGELPKSEFNLEQWKTVYANTDPTRPTALDFFWQHFDPEGYSLFFFTYNYPDECTLDFKTSNLFGGFLQRTDAVKHLARYSMCSAVILKKDKYFYIHGVWLFRGKEIPPAFKQIDDFNYYTWSPVDVTNDEQRTFVSDIWAWNSLNDFGGRGEYNSGRSWGC